jgi:hypothetical protein
MLSSSQIFLGISGSSRRLNLITSSNHMATLPAQQDEEVENALQLIYRRYIRMPMDCDTDKLFLRTARVADGTFVMELPGSFPIGRDDR